MPKSKFQNHPPANFERMAFDSGKYVLFFEEWKVLVCLNEKRQHGILAKSIGLHMQRHHQVIYDLILRQQIGQYATALDLCQPSEIKTPIYLYNSLIRPSNNNFHYEKSVKHVKHFMWGQIA